MVFVTWLTATTGSEPSNEPPELPNAMAWGTWSQPAVSMALQVSVLTTDMVLGPKELSEPKFAT
jgi:hypothetical protein